MASYLKALNDSLHQLFEKSESVIFLGEDVLDPYGGAFKVGRGLSSRFPDRVIATPISEQAITGVSSGLALRGFTPILEIMFGDFLGLCMDQVLNHLTKFESMYQLEFTPKVLIRTPMGGGRGYGPTHSQSLEKHFLGIPGLTILAPSHWHHPGELLRASVEDLPGPVLFIEHKLLYPKEIQPPHKGLFVDTFEDEVGAPIAQLRNFDIASEATEDITIICYGGCSRFIDESLMAWASEEIHIRALIPSRISPLPTESIVTACQNSRHILIIEEGTAGFTWGAEVAAQLYHHNRHRKPLAVRRLSSESSIVPNAKWLESEMLLSSKQINQAIDQLLESDYDS